jgi:hypothetical protein
MRLLLQPEHRAQADRYFAIVADTLRLYGEWFGAYPYGYLTIVDPAFQSFSDGWSTRRSSRVVRAGSRRRSVQTPR